MYLDLNVAELGARLLSVTNGSNESRLVIL